MKKIAFLITIIPLLTFSCNKNNTTIKQNRDVGKYDVFNKVTNRALSRYFKKTDDSVLLGKILHTQFLSQTKFANDTIEEFLIKLELCNNDMSEQIYIPCLPAFEAIIKINDIYKNFDTLIGTTNYLPDYYGYPYEDDTYVFTKIFIKNKNTGVYNHIQTLLAALVGYYIDDFGNKSIVVHSNAFYFREKLRPKERLENALVLYKWQNGKYVPDSLLTIDGELIPEENYAQAYEKYMGDSDY